MIGGVPLQVSYFLSNFSAENRGRQCHSNGMAKLSPAVKKLIKATDVVKTKGKLEESVTNLATDSRRVVPGSLFFALPGLRVDGNTFIEEAIGRGAVGIVTEEPRKGVTPVPVIQVKSARRALAEIAAEFYNHPEKALKTTGITGTNGKTTVAIIAQHLMSDDAPVGLIGTVRYDVGRRTFPAFRTTPEALDTFALMDQMRLAGCSRAVMEVSSHGIEQERIWGIPMDIAVFTNLTQDHLDYHKTFDAYYAAKARLFHGVGSPEPRLSVVNIDDPWGARLAGEIGNSKKVRTFGKHEDADLRINILALSAQGAHFELTDNTSGEVVNIHSPLLGEYNVYNLVAAIWVAKESGVGMDRIVSQVETLPQIPGRMERIPTKKDSHVLVDYAHTDDALRNVLSMLRGITSGDIRIVFGCGGDRDRSKRAKMVEAAIEGSDFLYMTSDNPRSEPIDQIFSDMRSALVPRDMGRVQLIRDRREAIAKAIQAAKPGDCVLIAGKGHENFQEIGDSIIPFDDRLVAREILRAHEMHTA